MSAFDSIAAKKPRENAGAMTGNRLAYQLDWGLKRLLELEEEGKPYTVIFDYQDDILVLDSDEDPQYIDFYQVKTNTAVAGWGKDLYTVKKKKKEDSAAELTLFDEVDEEDVEEDVKYSKIAKLLIHSLDFPTEARDFFFVTNARFGGSLIKGGKLNKANELDFSDLRERAKEEIRKKVKEELPNLDDNAFEHLHFIKNQMGVGDHEATVIGLLTKFINEHLPKAKISVQPVYDTLIGEIKRRNNYEIELNSVADLLKNKAFTRTQFREFLKGLETYESIEGKKSTIREMLVRYLPEKAAVKRRSILRQIDTIKENFLVYDNHEFLRLYKTIDSLIDETAGEYNEWEWSQMVLQKLKKDYSFTSVQNDDYLTCLILYEMCY
jgi:hypothetical protein